MIVNNVNIISDVFKVSNVNIASYGISYAVHVSDGVSVNDGVSVSEGPSIPGSIHASMHGWVHP